MRMEKDNVWLKVEAYISEVNLIKNFILEGSCRLPDSWHADCSKQEIRAAAADLILTRSGGSFGGGQLVVPLSFLAPPVMRTKIKGIKLSANHNWEARCLQRTSSGPQGRWWGPGGASVSVGGDLGICTSCIGNPAHQSLLAKMQTQVHQDKDAKLS